MPILRIPFHLEQGGCDVKMMIELIRINPRYTFRQDLVRQTFKNNLFGEEDAAETMDRCGDYLKAGGHADILCSSFQLLSWVKGTFSPLKASSSMTQRAASIY